MEKNGNAGGLTEALQYVLLTRYEYQEILLARMAGGDLYANEQRMKVRRLDMMLDKLRIACGGKPLYPVKEKKE